MSSELVTAVEVGKSLYVYYGERLKRYFVTPPLGMVEILKNEAENFRQIRISHDEWDTLLDWEDRVSMTLLPTVIASAGLRRLDVTEIDKKGNV